MIKRNTKIVCTLGPSSDSITEITRIAQAGMNVARLNFSHGEHKHHLMMIKNIRKVEKKLDLRIGILQDLQGPKIRLGKLPDEGITIKKGEVFKLTTENVEGKKGLIPIQYKNIIKDLKKGDVVLINDGLFEAIVTKKSQKELTLKAKTSSVLRTKNGVNCPTASISAKTITEKDKKDLKFGLKNNVDYVALSFVKSAKDIEDLRELIKAQKKTTSIIAKIERHEAVKNLKSFIKAADGIMVARGDLGVDVAPEQVPIIQKRIIALANRYAKPVITATQVLQSMVKNPVATRAEISDAANAVFDHTDAIMLSNESAVGKYPFKAAKTLAKVAEAVETQLQKHPELYEKIEIRKHLPKSNATCFNSLQLAQDINADFIVVYTEDGYTTRQVSRYRNYTPMISITPDEKISRQLSLVWGVNSVLTKKIRGKASKKTDEIVKYLKKYKLIKKGQKLVILCNASHQEKLISTYKV